MSLQEKLKLPTPQEIEEYRQEAEKLGESFSQEDEEAIEAAAKRRKTKILGVISVEELPDDIYEHQVRRATGLSLSDWEALPPHDKGYEMALYAIQNMIEGIKNYHQQEELRSKRDAVNRGNGSPKKRNKSKGSSRPVIRRKR